MCLWLALIVPTFGDIGGETVMRDKAWAGHPQPVEVGSRQIADIEPQSLRLAALLNDKLQQAENLARVAIARSGFEMDVQLHIRFEEPEVAESGGMGQAHTRRDFLPARVVSQILVWP